MKVITEEMKEQDKWFEEANSKEMSMEKLPAFLKKLTEDYQHDYGTIVHAMTAGAIATIWAMNRTPQGGITGFQASCVMWEFITKWMNYKGGMRLLKYDDMLYPQMEYKFEKTINTETWQGLQKKAAEELEKEGACVEVRAHWKSIVAGVVPFGYVVKEEA